MRLARLAALLVATVLAMTALTACGGSDLSDLSTGKLLAKARKQVEDAQYVTVKGTITKGSESIGMNLSYVGKDSTGTMTINGNDLHLETVDGKTYVKPSAGFWKAQLGSNADAVLGLVKGKWILADASNPQFKQLVSLTKRSLVSKQMLKPNGAVTKGDSKNIDGIDCIALKTKSGTLYLDQSDARPVQLNGGSKGSTGRAHFSYDKVAAPHKPSKDKVVDLAALAG